MTVEVTIEAAQDMKALFTGMADEQFRKFLVNSIIANESDRLVLTKEVEKVDGALIENFTLRFVRTPSSDQFSRKLIS